MLMTANPCADAERWESKQECRDQDWQERAAEIIKTCTADTIDRALEDGLPLEVRVKVSRAMRGLKESDLCGQNEGTYNSIGRVFANWLCEWADKEAQHV